MKFESEWCVTGEWWNEEEIGELVAMAHLPECPPDVEAHHIEPSVCREEREVDDDSYGFIIIV